MPGKAVNSPKTGAGRHELPTELETPLPAALYLNLKSVRRRICGHGAQRAAKRTPSASLSAAAPPSCPGRGFQRGGPQPAPLCRFKGVRGEIEIPPRFSLGGPGGTFSFQKRISPLASRPGNRGRPLRQRPLPLAPTWECPLAGASPPPCRIAAHYEISARSKNLAPFSAIWSFRP